MRTFNGGFAAAILMSFSLSGIKHFHRFLHILHQESYDYLDTAVNIQSMCVSDNLTLFVTALLDIGR